jgi:protein involved in polysaccharide export with SLBB domain
LGHVVTAKLNIRIVQGLTFAVLASWLTSCNYAPATCTEAAATSSAGADVAQPGEYRLGLGDRVRIKVYGADQISGEFVVDLSGSIDAPLLGTVKAAGLTTPDLRTEIVRKLRSEKIVDNPQVSVDLVAASPFYVLGEVEKSGEYPYHPGLNVVSAIATSGGFRYRADQNTVFIRRRGQTTETASPTSCAAPVYPGDVVRVPGRVF